jgi:hypothetical protein
MGGFLEQDPAARIERPDKRCGNFITRKPCSAVTLRQRLGMMLKTLVRPIMGFEHYPWRYFQPQTS